MPYSRPLPDPVHVRCDTCKRSGRYSRQRFIEIAGTDSAPEARLAFARVMGCAKAHLSQGDWQNQCWLIYDLAAEGTTIPGSEDRKPSPGDWADSSPAYHPTNGKTGPRDRPEK